MSPRLRIRRAGRRMRRSLGLPALSLRAALLIILLFLALAYVSVTIVADFFTRQGQYAPRYYEPKESERQQMLESQEKKR